MADDFNIRFAKQTATVWVDNGTDSAGDPTFATPRQISVRWEEKLSVILNSDGEQETSVARVYVSEDLKLGDYLFLGTSAASDPIPTIGAYKIKAYGKVPSLTGKKFIRRAFL